MKFEVDEIEINGEVYIKKSSINKHECNIDDTGKTYCIVRTYSAGVFAGWIDRALICDQCGTIFNSRRIHYWEGAASLSQLAVEGTSKPENCRLPCVVPETDLKQIIEVIPCSKLSQKIIEGVEVWRA